MFHPSDGHSRTSWLQLPSLLLPQGRGSTLGPCSLPGQLCLQGPCWYPVNSWPYQQEFLLPLTRSSLFPQSTLLGTHTNDFHDK